MSETEPAAIVADPLKVRDRRIILGLILLTLACYWPLGKSGFVNYDDTRYIIDNPIIRQGFTLESLKYAATSSEVGYWHPLTWLTHLLDIQLYGPRLGEQSLVGLLLHTEDSIPAGHHFTNLIFHLANTLLLWQVLQRMTKAVWISAWVAAIFAVHPMHVESVAWISERKDVLSTLFFLLTILAYHRYTEKPGIGRYLLVALAFAGALLSKPITITTPCVLLLLDVWPLNRIIIGPGFWRSAVRPVLEKLPLLLLSAGSAAITLYGTISVGTFTSLGTVPTSLRLKNVIVSYARYLGGFIWPTRLCYFYPYPANWSAAAVMGSIVLFCLLSALAIWQVKRRPYLLVGWLWFVGVLVPIIGFFVVGDASMADRYSYISFIGLIIAVGWFAAQALGRHREILIGLASATILGCAALAYCQVLTWHDSLALSGHALEVSTNNWTANLNYGLALASMGRTEEAGSYFIAGYQIRPNGFSPNLAYSRYLLDRNRVEDAAAHLAVAGRINPHDNDFLIMVARMRALVGDHANAIKLLQRVLKKKTTSYEAEMLLAENFTALGQIDEAEQELRNAIRLYPATALPYHRLGQIAAARNNASEAMDDFKAAINNDPDLGIAHLDYAITLAALRRYPEALDELNLANSVFRDDELQDKSKAELTIGQIMEKLNRPMDAATHYVKSVDLARQAVAQNPGETLQQYQLAVLLKKVGREDEAIDAAKQAMASAAEHGNIYFMSELKNQFPSLPVPSSATTRPTTLPAMVPAQ